MTELEQVLAKALINILKADDELIKAQQAYIERLEARPCPSRARDTVVGLLAACFVGFSLLSIIIAIVGAR